MGILQVIIEQILKRHGSPSAESYYLKLRMPSHDDFLVIGKVGEQILVGLQKDDLSAPMLAYDYNQGNWFAVRIQQQQTSGDTICSFLENGNRIIIPYRLKRFMLFQGMLGKNIKELNYLEKGEKVE